MGRKKKGTRRKKDKRIPIFATAGMAVYGMGIYSGHKDSGLDGALTNATGMRIGKHTTDGSTAQWDTGIFTRTWTAPALGMLGTVGAQKLGLNKYVRKIPFIGDFIKF